MDTMTAKPKDDEGVALADFHAFLPTHNYIFALTGAFWNESGVNAALRPIPVIGKDGKPAIIKSGAKKGEPKTVQANVWIDRHQPVHHMTWAPGHPQLIRG